VQAGVCGDLSNFKITIGAGVLPNCNNKTKKCHPQCEDPNQMPSFSQMNCIKKRGKMNVVPNNFPLTCSDNDSRTSLGACGDIFAPGNKKVINQIDETVKVTCHERYCLLSCKDENMEFDGPSKRWAGVFIRCGKSYLPKKINAKCVPKVLSAIKEELIAQAAPASASQVNDSVGKIGKCKTSVFQTFKFSEADTIVNCSGNKCRVKCKNGKTPSFTFPDGKKANKTFFICKKGKWIPKSGTLSC